MVRRQTSSPTFAELTEFLQVPSHGEAAQLPQLPLLLPPGVSKLRRAAPPPNELTNQEQGAATATAQPAVTQEPALSVPLVSAAQRAQVPEPVQRRRPQTARPQIQTELLRQARLDRLANKAVEISQQDAWQAQRVGFVPSNLVQMTLPHREPPRDLPVWGRQHNNGRSLVIQPGFYLSDRHNAAGRPVPVGLGYPFGSIPRLILAWVGREVVRTRSRELFPSESLAGFMRELGITTSNGGDRGSITRVRDQVRRLFSARIALVDKLEQAAQGSWSSHAFQLADSIETWWSSEADVSQRALFESRLVLSQQFFDELMCSPVPLDMRALAALKSSPMALDVYAYLTYRNFQTNQRGPVAVSWDALAKQFGSESEIGRFRQLFRQALHKVLAVYPQARFDADGPHHVILLPSPPHVRPRQFSFGEAKGPGSP